MNFLKKLFQKRKQAKEREDKPIWVSLFSKAEYDLFLQIVAAYFQKQGEEFRFEAGSIQLRNQNRTLNLQNLAQQCHQNLPDTWAKIVQDYFEKTNRVLAENAAFSEHMLDFDSIAPYLAVRIWPLGTLEATGRENCIYREELPDTISALVLDLPDSIQAVSPRAAAQWGKSTEALFAIGLANVRERCKPEMYQKALDKGVSVTVVTSENFFTATYPLFMDEFPELVGRYGSLVAIPHRHVMVCFPINGIVVIQAINQLMPIVDQLFREGPGSVSPHLYWYNQGKFTAISFDVQKKAIDIPPNFTEVLNQIADKKAAA